MREVFGFDHIFYTSSRNSKKKTVRCSNNGRYELACTLWYFHISIRVAVEKYSTNDLGDMVEQMLGECLVMMIL